MGDYDRAISIFDRAINSNPLCPSLWRSLAAAYKANGNYKAAAETLQRGVHVISLDYSFHLLLGNIHSLNAEFQDSVLACNAAIRSTSSHSILFAYIDNNYNYGDTDPISISIDESLQSHFLWYSLENARSAVSDNDGAAKGYEAAVNGYHIALRKNTRNKLLWRYSEPNVKSANFDVFARRESLPHRILWCVLGKAYECKGDFRQALRAYQMALHLEQDNAWLQDVMVKLGKEVPGHLEPVESEEDTEFWLQVEGVQQPVERRENPIVVLRCTNDSVQDFKS
jgi:tetratricopeptide (TPR) repeat protein